MGVQAQRKRILQNTRKLIRHEIPRRTERALVAIGAVVANKAGEYTPLHTSTLINSQDRQLSRTSTAYTMSILYTAGYAAALHERTDWKPRPVGVGGKKDGGYNPNATPKFLTRAGDETRSTQISIIKGEMKL